MTTPTPHKPRNIADLDRPLAQVEADAKRIADEKARRIAHELDLLQRAIPLDDGEHAEQRHWLDADPDTCVPLPGIPHPRPDQEATP